MTKQQTIDLIRQRNQSATPDFLIRFDKVALENYLARLSRVAGCRGRESRWVRNTTSPAATALAAA